MTAAGRIETRVSPEFRIDTGAGPCTVRGPVYPSFDPEPGVVYSLDEFNARVDSWGTFISEADVRKLADDYMLRSQLVDRMHDNEVLAGRVVESTVRSDDAYPTPTWFGGVRVDEAVAPEVRSGALRGFSIEVYGERERIEVMVRGKGQVPDLTGVSRPPFLPKYVPVEGERRICIDRLVRLRPVSVSIVDRPAIRQDFNITRSELVLRCEATDQLPAEPPSWLERVVERVVAAIGRNGQVVLAPDGSPPPAAALPPLDPTTILLPPPREARTEETPVTKSYQPSTSSSEQASASIARASIKRDGEYSFGSVWEGMEVGVNLSSMLYLLEDITYSRVVWGGPLESPEAVEGCLTALARDFSEFLGELRELLSFEATENRDLAPEARQAARLVRVAALQAAAQGEMLVRATALLTSTATPELAPAGTEQRAGKKFSKDTVDRMKAALAACRVASDHLDAMCKEAEPPETEEKKDGEKPDGEEMGDKPVATQANSDEDGAKRESDKKDEPAAAPAAPEPAPAPAPEPAPAPAEPAPAPAPTATEVELAEARAAVAAKDAEIAAAAAAAVTPPGPVTPDPKEAELALVRAELAEKNARLAEILARRQPSAQPVNNGLPATAPSAPVGDGEVDWSAKRKKYQEERLYGRGTSEG